ncbi:MAG: hypothetical protein ACOX6T_11400 [Myxococcales bacterium]|jgi:hypothetical protein
MPRQLDALLEYRDDPGTGAVFHLEFEAEPKADAGFRAFEHWCLARVLLRRPVRTIVIYLKRGAFRRRPKGVYVGRIDGRKQVAFRFEAIAFWKLSAKSVLAWPTPGLWSAVALCQDASLESIRTAFEQLESFEDVRLRRELQAVLYWIAGTRFEHQDLRWLVPKEVRMKSSTYEATLEEGREEGREQGRELERQATVIMLRRICLNFLRYKDAFEEHDEELIEAIDDPKRLEALVESLGRAVNADAARRKLLKAVGRQASR